MRKSFCDSMLTTAEPNWLWNQLLLVVTVADLVSKTSSMGNSCQPTSIRCDIVECQVDDEVCHAHKHSCEGLLNGFCKSNGCAIAKEERQNSGHSVEDGPHWLEGVRGGWAQLCLCEQGLRE